MHTDLGDKVAMAAPTPAPRNVWQTALSMLRRPAAPALPTEDARRKGDAAQPTWAMEQARIEAVLRDMATERADAEALIATVGQRREALLMTPDSDDQILALQAEMEKAALTIERLDRVEPDLYQRLGAVKFNSRNERWERVRDEFVPRFEAFAEAEREYLAVLAAYQTTCRDIVAAFPEYDVAPVLPMMPRLVRDGAPYDEGLEFFRNSTIVLQKPDRPPVISLQHFIDFARRTGEVHDECPAEWQEQVKQALRPTLFITLTASFTDTEGDYYKKGDRIELPIEQAMQLVRSNRAYAPGIED